MRINYLSLLILATVTVVGFRRQPRLRLCR